MHYAKDEGGTLVGGCSRGSSGSLGGRPPCPQDFVKIMQLKGQTRQTVDSTAQSSWIFLGARLRQFFSKRNEFLWHWKYPTKSIRPGAGPRLRMYILAGFVSKNYPLGEVLGDKTTTRLACQQMAETSCELNIILCKKYLFISSLSWKLSDKLTWQSISSVSFFVLSWTVSSPCKIKQQQMNHAFVIFVDVFPIYWFMK